MKQLIFLSILILLFGCVQDNSEKTFSSASSSAPVLTEVTPVTTPSSDSTPSYVFASTGGGPITFGGSCTATLATAFEGYNTITFNSLSDATYSNCTITVTDSSGNPSNTLTVSSFSVDTNGPTVSSVYPSDGQLSVTNAIDNITFTFNEIVDTSYISSDLLTTCSASLQVSSNSFSICVQMSSTPTASNDNKTFTITPSGNLTGNTVFKMRVTTSAKDAVGNSISGKIETSNGFMARGGEAGGNLV